MASAQYEQFFRDADKDSSGFLSFDELVGILRKIGYKDPESKIKRMFAKADTSGDGKLSLEEFLKEMGVEPTKPAEDRTDLSTEEKCTVVKTTVVETMKTVTKRTPSKYEQFFLDADADGSGFLSYDELVGILRKIGYPEPESKIKLMFKKCDTSGDGKISLDEFLKEMGQELPPAEDQTDFDEKCTVTVTKSSVQCEKTAASSAAPPSKYEKFFLDADTDGSGFLSYDELVGILRKIGYPEPESKIKQMFTKCDKSGDGKISLEEFLEEMGEKPSKTSSGQDAVDASETKIATTTLETPPKPPSKYEQFFRDADTDSSGFLTFDELVGILRKIGYKDPESKIKRMFARADTSGDGKISLEEFLKEMEL
jgi:Ca2+-binding EF-hand superfamily protein